MASQLNPEPSAFTADGEDAAPIDWRERDNELGLHEDEWGKSMDGVRSWRSVASPSRHFTRELLVGAQQDPLAELDEFVVRFPSAPIYGMNRKADYNLRFPRRPNMHTLRVLMKAKEENDGPISRVFILHNGLNETTNLRFYYRLATWILKEDERDGHRSACLIAPFPGHLMHAPFVGPFAQTPLSRYLGDSGELFRQFLRYMVEMRWLLSLLVKKRPESWMIGGMPLERKNLAADLLDELSRQRRASRLIWEMRRMVDSLSPEAELHLLGPELDEDAVQSSLDVLTHVLGLDHPDSPAEMPVHVVGYSLGGFLAQSVFFSWPNMVSSCSTICSGGAIRALSPTAFAHREEWQAVLHTLRPELEESMLGGRIRRTANYVAGLAEGQFGYYQRIFDQVFLQEDNASYKARLSEYGTRMLFISGGEDPIVRTSEVLDASPDEGITMLSIASLTHFLGEKPFSDREVEQREFWLPTAGELIGRAATRAEKLHSDARRDAQAEYAVAQGPDPEEGGTPPRRPSRRDLSSPDFEGALDWVIDGVKPKETDETPGHGWLFICRAGLPAAFLRPDMQRAWGAGLHHHDVSVQKYAAGLARRAMVLDTISERTTLVLPAGVRRTFVESGGGLVDPHSDAPGCLTTEKERDDAWEDFVDRWGSQARWLKAGSIQECLLGSDAMSSHEMLAEQVSRWQRVPSEHLFVTHLPDVWISVNNIKPGFKEGDTDNAIVHFIDLVGAILAGEPEVPLQSSGPIKAKGELGKELEVDLDEGKVRIARVSGAELNPRYRGRFEQSFWPAILLLAHCAAALVRSDKEADKSES
jgi:hypothetical protein